MGSPPMTRARVAGLLFLLGAMSAVIVFASVQARRHRFDMAARAFIEAGDPPRAEGALRRGLELEPDSPVPYRHLTDYYFGLDRAQEALTSVDRGWRGSRPTRRCR